MRIWAFLRWWYGPGWLGEISLQLQRLFRTEEYFSLGLLARTLFQPFRQIDAEGRRGGLDVQLRAFVDVVMSRFVGTSARTILMVIGSLWLAVSFLVSVVWLLVWPLLPFAPVLGLTLSLMGVRP